MVMFVQAVLESCLVARVVKLVDTRDLKSRVRKGVPVRFRSRAPTKSRTYKWPPSVEAVLLFPQKRIRSAKCACTKFKSDASDHTTLSFWIRHELHLSAWKGHDGNRPALAAACAHSCAAQFLTTESATARTQGVLTALGIGRGPDRISDIQDSRKLRRKLNEFRVLIFDHRRESVFNFTFNE